LLVLAGCASTVPHPIGAVEQKAIAASDRAAAQSGVEPLGGPLTLAEAIARALKYNLTNRTHLMEQALAAGQLDLSRYDLLPKLVADAGYSWRDSDRITRSKDSVTGLPSLANPYISSDRSRRTADLDLTWSVLDFGVSYYTARQNADRVLVASERRRKALHNLVQDVRTAYWRAASAQKIDVDLRKTLRLGESALADSRSVETERLRDPLEALRYQRSMLENMRILESVQRELSAAQIELAELINLPPGTAFRLAEPTAQDMEPARRELPTEHMEELAIANNAELKEQFYNVRIAVAETRKSMLRLLPGLSFSYGSQYDSDNYLINNQWQEAGVRIGANLFGLLAAPAVKRFSQANEKLAEQRRMATQMAVLAQVHLSRQQYDSAYQLYQRADQIWKIDQRIYEHSANREAVEIKGRLDLISNNTSAIVSLLRRFQALSQVYAASSKVEATLGIEPAVGDIQAMKLEELTQQVDQSLHADWNGRTTDAEAVPADVVASAQPQPQPQLEQQQQPQLEQQQQRPLPPARAVAVEPAL
jgi:outer membrane protein TolC